MRALFLLSVGLLLVSGCIQQPQENQTNQTPPVMGPANQSPPAAPPNVTPPQAPPEITGNITEQPPPVQNGTNQTGNGTAAPQNPKGLLFGDGKYLLVLDDVSVIPSSEEPCGIFSIRNATDYSVYEKMLICPPESESWTSPENHIYRIKVLKVAAGYSGGGSWVDVIIYG